MVKMERSLSIYLGVLKRRFWVILLLLVATMAVVLVRAALTPAAYRSSMRLQIIPMEPEEVALYTRLGAESSMETIEYIYFDFSGLLGAPRMAQLTLADAGVDMPVSELVKAITVERDQVGDLMSVSLTATAPEVAEQLLRRHVDIVLSEFRANRALPTAASGKFLAAELARVEQELEAARVAVLEFKLENRVESLDRALAAEEQALRDLNSTQQKAEIETKRLEAVIAALEAQLKEAEAATAAETDGDAIAATTRLAQDLRQQIGLRQIDAAGQRAEAAAIVPALAKRQANLASLLTLAGRYQELQDKVQEKLDLRAFLTGKAREARLKEAQTRSVGYVQVVSEPTTPKSQLPTNTVRTALLGALLSIVAGIILIFVLEFIERALRHSTAPPAGARGHSA